MHSAIYCCMVDETGKWSLFKHNIATRIKNNQTNLVNMKINSPTSPYCMLFSFLCGLSYLVMRSLRMIMCTFYLIQWTFNLIVRSLNLVMWTSHLFIISYFLVTCTYHLIQRSFYLVMLFCHSVKWSLHYWLLSCVLFMRSYYVLFLCSLFACCFYLIL